MTIDTRLLALAVLFTGAPSLAGCGTTERHLCKRAEECETIESDDVEECVDDLENAIEDDVISKKDVRECLECMEDNSCGLDIWLDCPNDCEGVGAIVVGSNFN